MRRVLVVFSASLLVLAACSSTKSGTAAPVGTAVQTPPTSAGSVPGPGVPSVDSPLDTARFKKAPCEVLTTDEVTTLLGSTAIPKEEPDAPGGPTCNWHPSGVTQASVGVIFNKVNDTGLTGIYEKKGTTYSFFEPQDPIDSYPVVAYGLKDERSSNGLCALAVGTSDHEMIDVSIAQSEANIGKKDPCAAARDVAHDVLEQLRGNR
ncbi:DUF3558 domain-containing protein [Amycolatopsis sp. WQ 127309]|uniref:DUF3558 domain-containing protein n=1 Tax=Amycolatopsis sp. WQ 127309 TaxID=2932773 RepID=UPI001FF220E3|nr:DUF3558 domain-containing protein [Amycolatopsis sp. WQ 127309]UOZ09536.1 DUF3558 domain-containing protein [Amycolatopsis sp. WQ 127309]